MRTALLLRLLAAFAAVAVAALALVTTTTPTDAAKTPAPRPTNPTPEPTVPPTAPTFPPFIISPTLAPTDSFIGGSDICKIFCPRFTRAKPCVRRHLRPACVCTWNRAKQCVWTGRIG